MVIQLLIQNKLKSFLTKIISTFYFGGLSPEYVLYFI